MRYSYEAEVIYLVYLGLGCYVRMRFYLEAMVVG